MNKQRKLQISTYVVFPEEKRREQKLETGVGIQGCRNLRSFHLFLFVHSFYSHHPRNHLFPNFLKKAFFENKFLSYLSNTKSNN